MSVNVIIYFIKQILKKILTNLKNTLFKDVDWSGRWETPMGVAGRVRPRRLAEEAKASRPMESEHPGTEIINIDFLQFFSSHQVTFFKFVVYLLMYLDILYNNILGRRLHHENKQSQ